MKPRTPGFWLIVATVGLLALLPMTALAELSPAAKGDFNYYKGKAEAGDPRYQRALGYCYAEGKGVPADPNEALKWYRKAADQGYAPAKSSIGSCYEKGLGVPKDEIEAVKWYRQAAEQGEVTAMSKMGLCYKNGVGVAKDEVEAATWFRKASEQRDNLERKSAEAGHASAQYQMGAHYYKGGSGVAKDDVEAVKWWLKALPAMATPISGISWQNIGWDSCTKKAKASPWTWSKLPDGGAGRPRSGMRGQDSVWVIAIKSGKA